jgi:hypothetical protein
LQGNRRNALWVFNLTVFARSTAQFGRAQQAYGHVSAPSPNAT